MAIYPMAAAIRMGGALVPVILKLPEREISAVEAAELLKSGLRTLAQQQQASALAICYGGRVSIEEEPGVKRDAIVVGLEHVDGESMDVCVRYRKRRPLGYAFEEAITLPRTRCLFPADSAEANPRVNE